jgi:hypothetical protein
MALLEAYFAAGQQILEQATPNQYQKLLPMSFGANLTIPQGMALGKKTSDNRAYPLNINGVDGTQNFVGFNQYSLTTDGSGNIYYTWGGTAGAPTFYTIGPEQSPVWVSGIFVPSLLLTSATGSAVKEVDTVTAAGTITTGDVNIITLPNGDTVEFVTGGTTTATAVANGLRAAWLLSPAAVALATTSGTATLILTAVNPGQVITVTSQVQGVGTLTTVVTTAAVAASQSEVDTFTASGSITAGDVNTVTINYPNTTTVPISFTVVTGSTTATNVADGLRAAWNASPQAAQYGTASGTATFIVTGQVGSAMSLTPTVVGSGTLTKVVTTPAYGQNIANIQATRPGAYVMGNGWWVVP